MTTSIPHLVPLEVSGVDPLLRHGLLATGRHGSGITVLWVEGVVDVAVKVGRAMKPRAGTDEHAPGEPFRAVVAGRSTAIRRDVVVAVRTFRCPADIDAHLGLCRGGDCRKAAAGNSSQHQKFKSTHEFVSPWVFDGWSCT